MNAAKLEELTRALPTPIVGDVATPPAGSTALRATRCICTGERPSAGFCPACHFVADWVPVEYAAAFVALANHGLVLARLLAACERWRAATEARRAYGESVYRENPFDICSVDFQEESRRLDRAIADRQRDVFVALADVHAVDPGQDGRG